MPEACATPSLYRSRVCARGDPAAKEFFDAGRVVPFPLLQQFGPLGGDDLTAAIEHGQEREADSLVKFLLRQRRFTFLQQLVGVWGLDVHQYHDVLVVQKLTNLGILLAQTVQLVTPASALEAKHHKHASILPFGLCGRRINLSTGVRLRVVEGVLLRLGAF
jgi:hypothetical protein